MSDENIPRRLRIQNWVLFENPAFTGTWAFYDARGVLYSGYSSMGEASATRAQKWNGAVAVPSGGVKILAESDASRAGSDMGEMATDEQRVAKRLREQAVEDIRLWKELGTQADAAGNTQLALQEQSERHRSAHFAKLRAADLLDPQPTKSVEDPLSD